MNKRIEFLKVIELEAMCLTLRLMIYPEGSRTYYVSKIEKKLKKIRDIMDYEGVVSIITNEDRRQNCINSIITDGYPNFTYNHRLKTMTDDKYLYRNSVIEYTPKDEQENVYRGVCQSVSLAQENVRMTVYATQNGITTLKTMTFSLSSCRRLNYQESDKYFWELYCGVGRSTDEVKEELLRSFKSVLYEEHRGSL